MIIVVRAMEELTEMRYEKIHILNGQSMYDFYKKTNFLKQEKMIPFNEAMCYGDVSKKLFSDEFIEIRSTVHRVTVEEYKEITLKPLHPLLNNEFTNIALWFDADMFCQINILTLLAWLDQLNHTKPIELHIVGDEFGVLETLTLTSTGYYTLYEQVLIDKTMPENISPTLLKKGIELYLNYLNPNGELMMYIKKHKNIPDKELMVKLLEEFTKYGLGDTQYMELIKSHRNNDNINI